MNLKNKALIIHPFFLAVYPLIFLYAMNIEAISLGKIVQASLWAVCISGVLFTGLGFITKQWEKASFLVSGCLLLFFYYGHVHEYLFIEHRISIGRHRYLLPLWGLVFVLLLFLIWKIKRPSASLTRFLNFASAFLLISAMGSLAFRMYSYSKSEPQPASNEKTQLQQQLQAAPTKQSSPDIYYIILDGYARQDTLAQLYEYPDNDLVQYLNDKGFYIASQSVANYAHTFLSLTSSLNLTHLLPLSKYPGVDSNIKKIPYQMLENNEVVKFLKSRGYTYIHFGSGYEPTQDSKWADVRINCYPDADNYLLPLLLKTTVLSVIEPRFPYHWFYSNKVEAEKKLCMFSGIEAALNNVRSPKFVFVHITLPHPPFLFKQDGSIYQDSFQMTIDHWGNRQKYKEQLIFLNHKVKPMIETILSRSTQPPIIILQGDHGPASTTDFDNPSAPGIRERMGILNAYFLPDGGGKDLYPSVTPVNSFRIIFNHYFDTKLKLESDNAYFSSWVLPYKFLDIATVRE